MSDFSKHTAKVMAEHQVSTLESNPETAGFVRAFEKGIAEREGHVDIRQALGTNNVEVYKRAPTEMEAQQLANRAAHVRGMKAALKQGGVGPNSTCPCESGKKFKKCCGLLLDDPSVDITWLADRLCLHTKDSFSQSALKDIQDEIKEKGEWFWKE